MTNEKSRRGKPLLFFCKLTKEVSGDIIKTYTYDASGNRKSFVLNKGEEAPFSYTYVYDKTDNIESIRDVVSNSTLVSYTYNGDGTVAEKEINSLWPGYYYDKEKRITEVEVITDDTDLVMSRTRTYGGTGQILQRGDDLYSYDATGRLVGETKSTSVVPTASNYIFDDFNNVMVKKYTHSPDYEFKFTQGGTEYALSGISLHEKTYAYNKNNHLLEQREYVMGTSDNYSGEIELVTRYTYDGIGNLVKKEHLGQQDGSEEEYTYNLWGQLTGYSDDTTEATYTYDASGRRTSKTVNGETTYHIWDGDYIIADVAENGSFIAKYHRFGSDLLELETGGKTYTYIVDGSGYGNVVSIALNENKKFDYSYDAYGNEVSWDKTVYNPFKYSSEYHDEETGLVYLRNRYYDSSIGRFITEDPAEDGTNWYVYCGNNPVMYVDPLGLAIRALTEIAEERGLSVSWNGRSGVDWAVTVDGHIITLNYQHTDGDWHLNLDGFAQSGNELSLHSDDNKVYIDDSLFNCWINDGSGVTEIKFEWYVAAGVAGIKAPGLVKGIIATLAPSAPQITEQISKTERIGSALKTDIFHRAASFANLQGGQAYTWINGDKTVSTLYQVAGELNGKSGIFEYLINASNQITHQIFVPGGVVNGILQGAK